MRFWNVANRIMWTDKFKSGFLRVKNMSFKFRWLIPTFGRVRQEDCEFMASVGYIVKLSWKADSLACTRPWVELLYWNKINGNKQTQDVKVCATTAWSFLLSLACFYPAVGLCSFPGLCRSLQIMYSCLEGEMELGPSDERGIFLVFLYHESHVVKQDCLTACTYMVFAQNLSLKHRASYFSAKLSSAVWECSVRMAVLPCIEKQWDWRLWGTFWLWGQCCAFSPEISGGFRLRLFRQAARCNCCSDGVQYQR